MDTKTTTMSAASRAAVLKREKIAAAKLARVAGKIAAAEKRAACETAFTEGLRKGREEIDNKIQSVRNALGVCKNEPNPSSILEMKQRMEFDMMIALRNQ